MPVTNSSELVLFAKEEVSSSSQHYKRTSLSAPSPPYPSLSRHTFPPFSTPTWCAMDILQQAAHSLSSRSAFTTHYLGAASARPRRMRQVANCNRCPTNTVCVYSHNPNESERMLLASSNTTYAAPLEPSSGSSFMIRPLTEILRDLNKRVPDQVLKAQPGNGSQKYIPWYHANRMLSFYAPGWCGEVRNITFSADGKFVTVIYRVTLRGSDGEAFREASGTVCIADANAEDPAQLAEALAFVRACARFGLGLYLHHREEL